MSSKAVAQFEDRKHDIVVKEFGGVNLSAHRTQIAQNEFAWLENLMPIGYANMPVTPGSTVFAAVSSIVYMAYANINGQDYMFAVKVDGSLVRAVSGSTVQLLVPGSLDINHVQIAQWKNERIVIIDTNNYRSYDGGAFVGMTQNGSVAVVNVTLNGAGYTSVPAVQFTGGGGLGAAGFPSMQINGNQVVVAGGAGYTVGDILTYSGGTVDPFNAGVSAQVRVETLGGGGAVATVSIYRTGLYTVIPGSPVATTGGTGAGATFTGLWNVALVSLSNGGTTPYIAAPTVTIAGGGFTVQATAAALLVAGPKGGQTIASYADRVWSGNNRTVSYSAPGSWYDFSAANAGGSFVMDDELLENNVNQLVPANGFLYIVGNTSIDTLSDVRVVAGSPPITNFSRVNVSPQIGSPFGPTNPLIPFGKALLFCTKFGIYSLMGSTPVKISEKLDLLFQSVALTGTVTGAGIAMIYGNLCPVFSVFFATNDAGTTTRVLLIALYKGKWFFSNQGSVSKLTSATFLGDQKLYASDGTNIVSLFSDIASTYKAATTVSWKAITALWPEKSPVIDKQVLACGIEVSPLENAQVVNPSVTTDVDILINVGIDNERGSLSGLTLENTGQWQNAAGVLGSWVNSSGTLGDFMIPGFAILQKDAATKGRYVGYTLTGTTQLFTMCGILGRYEDRSAWNASGVS